MNINIHLQYEHSFLHNKNEHKIIHISSLSKHYFLKNQTYGEGNFQFFFQFLCILHMPDQHDRLTTINKKIEKDTYKMALFLWDLFFREI
jgi:hypothetical protein